MKETFFRHLKVVELASVLAGPAVGMFFAELGADVYKIENPRTGGDITRRWKLPSEDEQKPYSAYYACVNWGKQVWMMDLEQEEDRRKVMELICSSDVVISNFKPLSARRMGMDASTLRSLHPGLIFAQVHSFGEDSDRAAFDVVLQAETGFMFMSGEPGGDPVRMPVALIDLLAAHQLKEGILLALLHKSRTGEGMEVSVSLLEAAIASLANQATNYLIAGHIPQPMGSMHPNIAPYGDVFFTLDHKPLVLAAGTERQYAALCRCLDCPELIDHPLFSSNALRVKNRHSLRQALEPAFRRCLRDEIMSRFHQAGVPAGSIRNMQEVFQLPGAEEWLLSETSPDGSLTKRVRTTVFKLSR